MPTKPLDGYRADLLSDHPAAGVTDVDSMHPTGPVDAGQRKHPNQLAHRQIEVKARRDHQRGPIPTLFTPTHGIKVDEPYLTWLNPQQTPHLAQSSPIGASAPAHCADSATYSAHPRGSLSR